MEKDMRTLVNFCDLPVTATRRLQNDGNDSFQWSINESTINRILVFGAGNISGGEFNL